MAPSRREFHTAIGDSFTVSYRMQIGKLGRPVVGGRSSAHAANDPDNAGRELLRAGGRSAAGYRFGATLETASVRHNLGLLALIGLALLLVYGVIGWLAG